MATSKRKKPGRIRVRESRPPGYRRQPRCFVIGGSNGSGKSTFAQEYLRREVGPIRFINADVVAAGLSPGDPARAAVASARQVLAELERLVAAREDFAFESTLSGIGYVGRLQRWKAAGYFIKVVFLRLASPDLALKRIAARVRQGGHDIPEADVRRRFVRSVENFDALYKPLADEWELYDNSGPLPTRLESWP